MDSGRVVLLGGTGSVGRALVDGWPLAERPRLRVLLHRSRPDWLAGGDVETCRIDADVGGEICDTPSSARPR